MATTIRTVQRQGSRTLKRKERFAEVRESGRKEVEKPLSLTDSK